MHPCYAILVYYAAKSLGIRSIIIWCLGIITVDDEAFFEVPLVKDYERGPGDVAVLLEDGELALGAD